MSNSFQPIQYSLNNVVEMKEYPKDRISPYSDEEAEGEGPYSFEDDAKEPLLNMDVSKRIQILFGIVKRFFNFLHLPKILT